MINVYYGGNLIQNLPIAGTHWSSQGDVLHMTIASEDSWLQRFYGSRFPTNSAHHQAIDQLGEGLVALQYAQDCVIEAVEDKRYNVLGVQWHPERMLGENSEMKINGLRVFEYFNMLCKKDKQG